MIWNEFGTKELISVHFVCLCIHKEWYQSENVELVSIILMVWYELSENRYHGCLSFHESEQQKKETKYRVKRFKHDKRIKSVDSYKIGKLYNDSCLCHTFIFLNHIKSKVWIESARLGLIEISTIYFPNETLESFWCNFSDKIGQPTIFFSLAWNFTLKTQLKCIQIKLSQSLETRRNTTHTFRWSRTYLGPLPFFQR